MTTKESLKVKLQAFFEAHPKVTMFPYLLTVVVPKYESKGERYVDDYDDLINEGSYEDFIKCEYSDSDLLLKEMKGKIPSISKKDAFYLFDEDTLVVASYVDGEVILDEHDYSDEIFDMY